ncbi:MAG: 2-C-methyl-D-erythritol 4-phosphate cytidylyltransferase [Cytophagales bacterium]|nr:2-C-methyl-D-erythritol 4-phosphate cytidylyltransferase [Cytophagales bacterium]
MQKYVVVVAGGNGSRMQSDIPKQFLLLNGLPVLMHTVGRLALYKEKLKIVLVLPEAEISYWNSLVKQYNFSTEHFVVKGGSTRFQSVRNGLNSIANEKGLVAIHDGVRPFVTSRMLEAGFEMALKKGSAIATVELKDSIRELDPQKKSVSRPRTNFRLVQTPQCFLLEELRDIYNRTEDSNLITDDAYVAENNGIGIELFEGSYKNIKITTPEDLLMAEAISKGFDFNKD